MPSIAASLQLCDPKELDFIKLWPSCLFLLDSGLLASFVESLLPLSYSISRSS